MGGGNDKTASAEQPEGKKKRKLFNVGKILSGGIVEASNVMLGCGGVLAPNPAIAFGVIGSCAVAIGSICQAIGELRGE